MLKYSVTGILTAVRHVAENSSLNDVMQNFGQTALPEETDSIRNLLSMKNSIPQDLKDVVRYMPIFRTCNGSGFRCEEYTSVKVTPQIAPTEQVLYW